jgi:outer membrane protein insertion porin family
MAFQPGDEVFNYQVSLNEPRFLQTDYSVGGKVGYTRRFQNHYNEEKFYSRAAVGRKFGDIWSGRVSLTANRVELTDIDNNVPLEIFNDRGPASVDAISLAATRTTLKAAGGPRDDQRIVKGSRLELGISQYGIFSSDYTFTKSMVNYTKYFTVDKDFIGRRTTLRLDGKVGYIFGGDAPTFESYYLGGRSFRGFDFRTVSPKGTPRFVGGSTDVPIGGDWLLLLRAQYEMPVGGKFLSTVLFVDSGTVTDSPGFDDYRVSVGAGLRLYIPQLGNAPLAFDFGFPVVKQESDVKKVFSFSIQFPF